MMKTKYLILGAGISGCSAARLLQLCNGEEDFKILESESEPGGLCRSRKIGDHILDIGGGHFLCSRFPEVYDFIFRHIPESEFRRFSRVSKVRVEGETIDYPIEFNLWQLSGDRGLRYLRSALETAELRGQPQPANFQELVRWRFGEQIADHYMIPYNRKMWGVEPGEMDVDWLSKLPRFDREAIRQSWDSRDSLRGRMPSHEYFYYPAEGGFQRLFDAIAAPVRDNILVDHPVTRLEWLHPGWRANGSIEAETVISTLPWATVHAAAGCDPLLAPHVRKLQCSSLVVSLHEEPYAHDWHWLYTPDESDCHHRDFFIHNFASHSAPNGLFRETNLKRWIPGKGEIFCHTNPAAYPIPLRGHTAAAAAVIEHYEAKRLYGLGRWGQHAYFNSDVCIREAMLLIRRLTA